MRTLVVWVVAAVLPLVSIADAFAERAGGSTAEVAAGMAMPVGDDDYEDLVDDSFKLGVRVVAGSSSRAGGRLALELGFDYTLVENELDDLPAVEADAHRVRLLGGVRLAFPLAGRSEFFLRAAAGLDYVSTAVTGQFAGVSVTTDDTSAGIALEAGAGVAFGLGGGRFLAAHVAFPIALHDEDADDEDDLIVLDYTGYDVDVLLAFGTRF